MWLLVSWIIDNVIARGLIISNGCSMCLQDAESATHLFLLCPTALGLWNFFLVGVGVTCTHPPSIRDLFCSWPPRSPRPRTSMGKVIWAILPRTICWSIWTEQNRLTFEELSVPDRRLCDMVFSFLFDWSSVAPVKDRPSFGEWLFDWDSFMFIT